MKYRKAITVIMVFGFFFSSMMIFSGSANAWSVYVTWSPTKVHTGETVTFHMTVRNTGDKEMKITKIGVRFDWMPSDSYYMVSGNFPIFLKPGETYSYQISIPIPDNILTHTSHEMDIRIEAADPSIFGLWIPYTKTVYGSIFVTKPYYKIYGSVKDPSGNPIQGAIVKIGDKTVTTNYNGYYSITVEKGTYTMTVEADDYKDYQTTLVVSGNLKKDVVLEPVKKSILNNAAGNGGNIASLTMGVLVLVIFIIVIVGLVWRSKKRKENYEVRDEDTENLETEQQMIGMGEVNKEEDEITEKLRKLKELYEEGLITEEEYKERRKKLLENL